MVNFFPEPILALETSCDETSAAVLFGRKVLSNVVSSQATLHEKWGGVVPEMAARAHVEAILPVIQEARPHPDQRVLTDLTVPVAEAGKFALVLVTDPTGKVIATTDRRFDHQIISSLAKTSYPADAQNINGRLRLDCAVLYQGQHVGALRVEVSSSAF